MVMSSIQIHSYFGLVMRHVIRCKPSAPQQSHCNASFILMIRPADTDALKAVSVISRYCLQFCLNTKSNGDLILIKSVSFIMVSLVSFTRLWMSNLWGASDLKLRFVIWESETGLSTLQMCESILSSCLIRRRRFVCYYLTARFINIPWRARNASL